MDIYLEVIFFLLSLVFGFILGFFANWYFYKKQHKENEAITEVLKRIEQHNDVEIRLGNDKRGKIVKRPDGTIAIDWKIELKEPVTVSATPRVEVEKKKE